MRVLVRHRVAAGTACTRSMLGTRKESVPRPEPVLRIRVRLVDAALDWRLAGHGAPIDSAQVPRARMSTDGRRSTSSRNPTDVLLFPASWPAGISMKFATEPDSPTDTVADHTIALVADGKNRPPTSAVQTVTVPSASKPGAGFRRRLRQPRHVLRQFPCTAAKNVPEAARDERTSPVAEHASVAFFDRHDLDGGSGEEQLVGSFDVVERNRPHRDRISRSRAIWRTLSRVMTMTIDASMPFMINVPFVTTTDSPQSPRRVALRVEQQCVVVASTHRFLRGTDRVIS